MDRSRLCFLALLRCALGAAPSAEIGAPGEEVFRLAQTQTLLPVLVDTAARLCGPACVPPAYRRTAARLTSFQTAQNVLFQKLLDGLLDAGLSPLSLRGASDRVLFPAGLPLLCDVEELAVRPEEREECERILLDHGLAPENGEPNVFCRREKRLCVRLTVLPDFPVSRLLTGPDGARCPVPAPTPQLLWRLRCASANLCRGGVGLADLCGICLLAERYDAEIDWPALREELESAGLEAFAAAVFQIGRETLGLQTRELFPQISAGPLLDAMLEGGVYGCEGDLRAYGVEEGRPGGQMNTFAYLTALRALIEGGRSLTLTVSGSSMTPFLCPRRDRVRLSPPERPLRRGDVVFYQQGGGQFILHRILRAYGGAEPRFDIVGDAQTAVDRGVRREQIFALAVDAERKGRPAGPGHFWWRFFAGPWLRLLPLRPVLTRLYAALRGR